LIADQFSAASFQADHLPGSFYTTEFFWKGDPEFSEDCLYLNVWTPSGAAGDPERRLPVAMWIHGGAYSGGWGFEIEMDGEAWAERDVILVTINYRLGILGFLSHPLLSAESPHNVSGNYGIFDQVAALAWVKNNIAAFGGDPGNIMIFGQSAGAGSVKNLVVSPLSKNSISKAVIQSGGGVGGMRMGGSVLADAEVTGKKVMDTGGYETLEQMYAASPGELRAAQAKYAEEVGNPMMAFMAFSPVQDGYLIPTGFDEAVFDNTVADIPYMIGCNAQDIGDMRPSIARFCEVRDSLSTQPAYAYYFTRALPGDESGAFHSAELWYVFHTLGRSWRPFVPADYELSDKMVDCWTNFAKYGDPNGPEGEEWEPYFTQNPEFRVFDIE
jgi:para-nitrobenzyl esterase